MRGAEAESKRHAIPRNERYGVARELGLRQVRRRLEKAGKKLPFYDVNQGAKDMLVSCERIERELLTLKTLKPAIRRAVLAKRMALATPSGFEAFDWTALREGCLSVCGID